MKQKLQIIALIFLAIIAIYIGVGAFKIALKIILSKLTLLAVIVAAFIFYKKTHETIAKIILIVFMVLGVWGFDIIYNIVFLGLVISFMALFKRTNFRKFGVIQILMIVFVVIYLIQFGVLATLAKLLSVLSLIALFTVVIWRELKIYFTPTTLNNNAEAGEIEFVDQNAAHNYTKTQQYFGRFINLELMTRDIALNIIFTVYILLVMIDLLSNIIYGLMV